MRVYLKKETSFPPLSSASLMIDCKVAKARSPQPVDTVRMELLCLSVVEEAAFS